jgi:tRNA/tmRNA/rRNA uracil-C5-methylase (TrmA/RlmC/RlmD family)
MNNCAAIFSSPCSSHLLFCSPSEVVGGKSYKKKKKEENMTVGELIARMTSDTPAAPDAEREGEKTSYMVASAGDALRAGQALGANVLIVDPPRKGLEDEVIEELCKSFNAFQDYVETKTMMTIPDDKVNWTNDVETLVYVSCGFDALARDCERLLSSRAGWMLKSATGYVLFPGSDHVETVAVFQRELR